ncbi:ankyrin repeat domain-containing protein [Pontiella sp.]|uniref:ankyrin repeat domain-containing protein n=1 Tax=Pontiella sp. TaxID=2837462 RepID=UPI003562D752
MKLCLWVVSLIGAVSVFAEAPKSVLLVAGKPSHGPGEHEFTAGCDLLAQALNGSGLGIAATVEHGAWPAADALANVDAVVVYCDGNKQHLLLNKEAELLALSDRGVGIVFLHYALDGMPGRLDDTLMKVVGGYYDDQVSQNPLWTLKDPVLAEHPVTRGVNPFELKEECYYNLKFGDVEPLLQAVPPGEERAYALAWAYGANRFGFTGGHFHSNWGQPDYRRFVLNAIVWAAGLEVPEGGVESPQPVVLKYKSMLHAIAKGDPADLASHIALGEDVNAKDARGWTPLLHAAVRNKAECAAVLIEKGAELNPRDGTQKTPLHYAADRGYLALVKLLAESGADLTAKDDESWTPLHNAAEKDRVEVAAYLIAKGAAVDAPSRRGGTPLHEAAASASADMIKLLLESGADKTIKASNGKTPLDYAVELGNEPARALLK